MDSAQSWLRGTFLHVRFSKNPDHYRLDDDMGSDFSLDDSLKRILSTNIASLQQHELVKDSPRLQCSEYGDAMARYCIQFETMKFILELSPKAKISEIVCVVSHFDFHANAVTAIGNRAGHGVPRDPLSRR